MCEMVERRGPAVITARCQDQSNQSRPSVVNLTGHHPRSPRLASPPLLLSKITCDRDATRSPSPLRSRPPPNPIGPVAAPLHRTAEARREPRNQADRPSQSIRRVKWARRGAGFRHGDHARRRRIGVEGGGRGRRPGRGLELGRHPAAHLLRLPLPLLRVGPPRFARVPLRSSLLFLFVWFPFLLPSAIHAA
jgi:hypothetical protein